MSEVNLAALAESGNAQIDAKAPTPMQELNEALKECKFGLFQIRLLCTSFFAISCAILVSNTTPYILPNAECDLNMNLLQKGILNATPFVGMIIISVAAGFLTDTFGRKLFLVGGFGGIFIFSVISSLSQTYVMLVASKFCEGILFGAAFSSAMTFTSEFCHNDIRDRVMLFQSSYQATGQILLAGFSWAILTNEWKYSLFNGTIVLNTWNFYLLLVSLMPLTACILYTFLPESPKYLLTQHKYEEARAILIKIYVQNSRKPADTFSHVNLWKNRMPAIEETKEEKEERENKGLRHMLVIGLHNIKPMFKKPLGPYLALFGAMNFLIMLLYNVIRLWFPQLSTIVEYYNQIESNQDLCVMLDAYTSDLRMRTANSTAFEVCVPRKSGTATYVNSMILGSVCLLPYLFSGVLVNKIGKKYLEMISGVIAVACTLSLRWASSKTAVVALFSIDLAVAQTMMSLLQAMTIEVFPTTTRTLAISMTMTTGRIGTLCGNIAFPILLDMGCVIPFFTLTGVMICVTVMTTIMPKKKKK